MSDDDLYGLTARLVDALHTEALILADEARTYFDEHGRSEREGLAPIDRVVFSCEALKVTTRLMHVISWLMSRRAAGAAVNDPRARRLGEPVETDMHAIAPLPPTARHLIVASRDLHERVRRLETDINRGTPDGSPALNLMGRLQRAL